MEHILPISARQRSKHAEYPNRTRPLISRNPKRFLDPRKTGTLRSYRIPGRRFTYYAQLDIGEMNTLDEL